jgi:hypothetical protein
MIGVPLGFSVLVHLFSNLDSFFALKNKDLSY